MENNIIKAGTKIAFMYTIGAQSNSAEFYVLTSDTPSSELNDFAWGIAKDYGESYGVYEPSEEEEEEEEEEGLHGYVYEDIEGWYEVYNPEEHDGYLVGSGPIAFREY